MSDYPSIVHTSLRSIDSLPVRMSHRDMLDLDRVTAHIALAREHDRYSGPTDPTEYLFYKQCLVNEGSELLATPAGILCFGHHPQQIFARAVVDIGHYRGVTPLSFEVIHLEKDVGGTIFDQIERVETYLWANTHHGMTLNDSSTGSAEIRAKIGNKRNRVRRYLDATGCAVCAAWVARAGGVHCNTASNDGSSPPSVSR